MSSRHTITTGGQAGAVGGYTRYIYTQIHRLGILSVNHKGK